MTDHAAAYGLMAAFDAEEAMDRAAKAKSSPNLGDELPPGELVKVREILFGGNGYVAGKWGLNWATGDWVRVPEGAKYPPECFAQVERACCRMWKSSKHMVIKILTQAGSSVQETATVPTFCPECGAKLLKEGL
jgi:hypothetical protein